MRKRYLIPLISLLNIPFVLAQYAGETPILGQRLFELGQRIFEVIKARWFLFITGLILFWALFYYVIRAGLDKSNMGGEYQKGIAVTLALMLTIVILIPLGHAATTEQVVDRLIFVCEGTWDEFGACTGGGSFTWMGWLIGVFISGAIAAIMFHFFRGWGQST